MRKQIAKHFGRLGNNLFQFAYIYGQHRRGAINDLYVQDPVYFDAYRGEIRELYGAENTPTIYKTAIHVRRGDYVNNAFYVDLFVDGYYERAMSLFDGQFIVFSDDIEWCKKQGVFSGCEFSEGDEESDFQTMKQCAGLIIANSSFSWWAAYLSSAKVVAPLKWYTDGVERTKCLKEWTRV